MAIGTPGNDGNGEDAGHVRVFQLLDIDQSNKSTENIISMGCAIIVSKDNTNCDLTEPKTNDIIKQSAIAGGLAALASALINRL